MRFFGSSHTDRVQNRIRSQEQGVLVWGPVFFHDPRGDGFSSRRIKKKLHRRLEEPVLQRREAAMIDSVLESRK